MTFADRRRADHSSSWEMYRTPIRSQISPISEDFQRPTDFQPEKTPGTQRK